MKAIIGNNEYTITAYSFIDNGVDITFTNATVEELQSALASANGYITIEDGDSIYEMEDYYEVRADGSNIFIGYVSPEDAKINALEEQVNEVVAEPTYVHVRASQEATIAAQSRVNVQIPLTVPAGYSFGAYRGLSMAGGWEHCFFQFFDSADGGAKANIGVFNSSDAEVTVTVSCTILFMRDLQQVTGNAGGEAMEEGEEN